MAWGIVIMAISSPCARSSTVGRETGSADFSTLPVPPRRHRDPRLDVIPPFLQLHAFVETLPATNLQ
jgi:hypothetical protein